MRGAAGERFNGKLYVKPKTDSSYRLYRLYDKVARPDIMAHAYALAMVPVSCQLNRQFTACV